jgi:hypothetical protein
MFRHILALGLIIALTACTQVEQGCGYWTSEEGQMQRIKDEMRRQGMPYEMRPDGMLYCHSADAERFRALVDGLNAARLREIEESHAGEIALLTNSVEETACLSAALARRDIAFRVDRLGGKQSVEWKPANDAEKAEVMAMGDSCRQGRQSLAPPNISLQADR